MFYEVMEVCNAKQLPMTQSHRTAMPMQTPPTQRHRETESVIQYFNTPQHFFRWWFKKTFTKLSLINEAKQSSPM
jgi:hypothetical protein